MGRCGGWEVGLWKCVWGFGKGVERVFVELGLVLGKGRWGCRKVWVKMWDNPGVRRRVASRSRTPTLQTPNPPTLRFLATTHIFAFFKLRVECTLCRISGRN